MTTTQLSFGTQITSAAEVLRLVTLDEVHQQITADPHLASMTDRLRKLSQLDTTAAKSVKTRLPYVVGSRFADGSRRTEHLLGADFFVLDLDDCTDLNGTVPDEIRRHESVALAFVSPGGRGLKLFFPLSTTCTDPKAFSAAYRQFATQFGADMRLTRSVDLRTSDPTRACFLAHDPTAYLNGSAVPLDWQCWLPDAPSDLFAEEERPLAGNVAGNQTALAVAAEVPVVAKARPIDEAAYRDILHQINPRSTATTRSRERQVYVPEELTRLEAELRTMLPQHGLELKEVVTLNYGLKFCVTQGLRLAEINVFFGKRGFSLVKSPRTGTDPALADRLHDCLYTLLFAPSVVESVPFALALN
ncbi:hypothetical protein GCM10023187_34540 [Nibrella viscosa]|uniref:BT4734-like N-terminal domain-containing protein n=1 Tax=Nibrella viscosa TaxID=1084524 RepID=A0ABP8KLS2_9BACT